MIDPYSITTLTLSGAGAVLKALDSTALFGRLAQYLLAPENRRTLRRVVWIACVLLLVALNAAAIFGFAAIWNSYKPGITVSVILWAIFLGTTASLLFPNKVITATFGGLVGVSLS
jgi:hypothetical protein